MTDPRPTPSTTHPWGDYERDGSAIYAQSFATIRAETDLTGFPPQLSTVVVRMIHACGQTDLTKDIVASANVVTAARTALAAAAPIYCDAHMVAEGITTKRLPAQNPIRCTLRDDRTPALATELATTRSAAAVDLWTPHLEGAIAVIGNAPTALFRLLEVLAAGGPRPAAIVGVPVGFIGAAESKQALIDAADQWSVPYLTVRGRRGGSAIACAAVNALATPEEILP